MLSNTPSTCRTPRRMWLIKIFSALYFTAVCAAQTPLDGVSPTSPLPESTTSPMVNDPPILSLQKQSTWLDVFPSETVQFNCRVTGSSDWTFRWSRNEQEVQDRDPDVLLSPDGSMLEITSASRTHAGSYTCKGHHKTKKVTTAASNPLELTVYENKPKPSVSRSSNYNTMYPGESITFSCKVNVSSGWEYMWYHDKKETQANQSSFSINSIDRYNSGQYYCKAKRGKGPFYTEESNTTRLQVSDPPKPTLKLQTDWTDVFENETVVFSCVVDSFDWTVTWYKDQEQLQEDFGLTMDAKEPYLNITFIIEYYQGTYACRAHLGSRRVSSEFSNTINVTVYENLPKPTLTKDPGINPMYVGEIVNLTCAVDVSWGWEYHWYKDEELLSETSKTITIRLGPSNGGIYSCFATRGLTTLTENSDEIQQHVIEIPVPSLKATRPWLDVFPAESVKLICGMDNGSDWMYMWYKDEQTIRADNGAYFSLNGPALSIGSASAAHAGQYSCKGYLTDRPVSSSFSSGLNLTVYDAEPTVTLMQDPDYKLMFHGESVSFYCQIGVSSGWEYLWHKEGRTLGVSGNRYTVSTVGITSQGSYKCQGRRGTNPDFVGATSRAIRLEVQEKKPKPWITQQPDDDKVYIGESVFLSCKVELSSGWEYTWYKDGAQLPVTSSNFTIHSAYLLNSGTYTCMARRSKTMYNTELSDGWNLHVSELPVPFLMRQTPWMDVFPTESVKLSCRVESDSDWSYTWYKDGRKVQSGNNILLDATTLTISSASASHRGQYSCSGKLKGRSVTSSFSYGQALVVYDSKPRVTLMQNPSYNVMHTGESVTFSCHVNDSSGWEYLWFKDDSLLAQSGNNHTITSVLTKNSGSYKCQTKRGRNTVFYSDHSQAVRLNIKELPKAEVTLTTGWSEAFSTDSLVLKCEVHESLDSWNYTWFKEDQPIDGPLSEKYTVTPQSDPDQSLYTCQGIRSGRPSYSQTSEHFKTKNLLLKRRVLLSISGCIFFGIIVVFLGCIVLRVTRKPAEDEYKPEEADLFLSMEQFKGLDDAPCPLFQYITNAELNSSSKEGDENAVTDSETTPLPIVSEEDQAVTTENHSATGNGAMVSFKQ